MVKPQADPTTGETSYAHFLSDAEREAFTEGDCHILALEIHRRTRYPLIAVGVSGRGISGTSWEHIAVQTPEGYILDATGIHTADTIKNTWGDSGRYRVTIQPVVPADIHNLLGTTPGVRQFEEVNAKTAAARIAATLTRD